MSLSNSATADMADDFDFSFASTSGETTGFFSDNMDYSTLGSFEPINHRTSTPASNVQTVSPKDIMVDSMSAPPSASFTDLTTPGTSYEQSPYGMLDTSETSPLFSEADLDKDAQNWPSLFETTEQAEEYSAPVPTMVNVTAAPAQTHQAPKMSRNNSSPGSSARGTAAGRHSLTAGVAAKRRDKPLPDITVEDPGDVTAVKRARNTMAARKSRQKRMERTEQLENKVQELEDEIERWKAIALRNGHVE